MAAKKILTPYDFTQNEIQNAVMQVLASAPASPVAGQFYYDSTFGRPRFRGASAWLDYQPLDADLTALAALAANGIAVRTAADTWAVRSLAASTAAVTWTNADGVAGNPSIAIANAVAGGNAGLMSGADKTKLDGIAAGATANATDAQLRDRATHTGTQTAATISDFDTQVRTSRLDQMAAPTAAVSLNNQRITNLAAPTAASDAATRQYVDDAVAGLSWKNEVRAATTANGALATAYQNASVVDGVTLATGDRILIKNQTTASENGIYVVNATGAPTRAADADIGADIVGAAVFVVEGSTNGGTRWVLNNSGSVTVGTTALTFVQFGGGNVYTAGNGLTLTGNDFNVGAGTGIVVGADTVSIDTAVVARKSTGLIGNGTLTQIDFAHNLANQWVTCQLFEVATLSQVEADIVLLNANTVRLIFSVAPTTNAIRVVVTG